MRKFIIHLFPMLLLATIIQAQEKKMQYFDKNLRQCSAEAFTYSRSIEKKSESLYEIHDNYANGMPILSGHLTSPALNFWENRTGHFIYYNAQKGKASEGEFVNGKRHGKWIYYVPGSDMLLKEVQYENGDVVSSKSFGGEGQWVQTLSEYEHGQVVSEKQFFRTGKLRKELFSNGDVMEYYPNGKEKRSANYKGGKLIVEQCFDLKGKDTECVQQASNKDVIMPTTTYDLNDFLGKTVHYPDIAMDRGITGKVIVQFVVMEDGSLAGILVLKGVSPSLDEEALRVVASMPAWQPGYEKNKPVRVYFNQPITFALE